MANSNRDNNRETVMIGVSSADQVTPIEITINPVTNAVGMQVATEAGLVVTVGTNIERDGNRIPVMCGVSSLDNVTPVPIHVTPNGRIIIVTA